METKIIEIFIEIFKILCYTVIVKIINLAGTV
jgi:hypothetical protein